MPRHDGLLGCLTLLLLVPPACDGGQGTDLDGDLDPEALYRDAVADAAVVDADEVVDTLLALRPDSPDDVVFDGDRVLLVTWTDWDGYDGAEGQTMPLGVEVWVSAAPHLQRFCRGTGLSGDALTARLEQRLGLPPGGPKDRIVEFWADPADVFRPTPDPEIDDSVADLDFPETADDAHRAWIEALRAKSYGDPGYPWTQLGYTYDWAPGAASEIGESEFVVRKGSEIEVASVTPHADYCK
jgi:hypothetical protein